MIYVSKSQLSQVEYLIGQSIQGNHVLFDPATVRRVFGENAKTGAREVPAAPNDAALEEGYAVEHHIERLILQPSLEEKRAYLEALEPEVFACVVRTYFNIVENNIFETLEVRH